MPLLMVGVHAFKDEKSNTDLYIIIQTLLVFYVMRGRCRECECLHIVLLKLMSLNKSQKKIKTSGQSDWRVTSSAPRLLDVEAPHSQGVTVFCQCGAWQTQRCGGGEKRCALDYTFRILIDWTEVPADTSIQPVAAFSRRLRYNRWACLTHLLSSVVRGCCHS